MGRAIDIVFRGSTERLTLERATRDRLYGCVKRLGLDAAGRECGSALLTRDGRLVLGPGGTAGVYLDDHGDAVAREDLAPADESRAQSTALIPAEPGPMELSGPVPAEALLAHTATAMYIVDGLDPSSPLAAAIAAGDIFQVPPTASGLRSPACFLLANEHGAFLVASESARFEFVGPDMPPPAEDDFLDASDDLDFGEAGAGR